MSRRRLSPDEAALWHRVSTSVRALPGRVVEAVGLNPAAPEKPRPAKVAAPLAPPRLPPKPPKRAAPVDAVAGLDRGWDRRLATGGIVPDSTIDLHGHTLASAHAVLDAGLDRAIRGGDRIVLLVTGRPPRPESERPHARGAIRAAILDWLQLSRHASRIAAIRNAHPRHGGQGALYVVIRRPRA